MKECSRWGQRKGTDEFGNRGARKQPWCKECNRLYARRYYQDNKPKL